MAFLGGSAPGTADDELGPRQEVEYAWGFSTGYVWAQKKRTTYTYRVFYAIDDTGGEAPNATWTVGVDTYNLRSTSDDLGYLDKRGILTCVYEKIGSWAWV
jgi:hypothetical protein